MKYVTLSGEFVANTHRIHCPYCSEVMKLTMDNPESLRKSWWMWCPGCGSGGPRSTHSELDAMASACTTYTGRIGALPDHARLQVEAIIKQYGGGE